MPAGHAAPAEQVVPAEPAGPITASLLASAVWEGHVVQHKAAEGQCELEVLLWANMCVHLHDAYDKDIA